MPHAKLLTMKYLCEQFPLLPPPQFGSILFWVNCGTWPRNAVQLTVIHHAHIPYSLLPLLLIPYSIYRLFSAPYWNCFSHLSASFELILEINVQSWQLSSRRINLNWIDNLLRLFKLVGSVSKLYLLATFHQSLSLSLEFTFTLSRTFVCQLGLAAAKLCGFGFLWAQVNLSFSLAHKMGILCALLLRFFFFSFWFLFSFFAFHLYFLALFFWPIFSTSQPANNELCPLTWSHKKTKANIFCIRIDLIYLQGIRYETRVTGLGNWASSRRNLLVACTN